MKNILLCILYHDAGWAKAFLRTVSLDHPGYTVTFKTCCSENCEGNYDVCIDLNSTGNPACRRSLVPACGRKAGVTALLTEAKRFIVSGSCGDIRTSGDFSVFLGEREVDGSRVACIHSLSGGVGTSCASIGIGRELSRYREAKTVYLCLTDIESDALLPESCSSAMTSEELLYRCLRTAAKNEGDNSLEPLIQSAFIMDEYGLFRLGANSALNALSALTAYELAGFLALIERAIGSVFFVLDFGTRLRLFNEFCEICDAKTIEIVKGGPSAIPECPEDVRHNGGKIDIALTNAFGLKIKELCDSLWA